MKDKVKEPYFVKDKNFFKSLFKIMVVVALQNLLNYSVNMADNLMLGTYGQNELSGVACVSQIFFVVSCLIGNCGAAFSVLAAQYWGQKDTSSINRLGGILLKVNVATSIIFFVLATVIPEPMVRIFTSDAEIARQGVMYLSILKWTFIPYAISYTMMDILRNVETVAIAFYMSITSLVINVCLNYLLIFGSFGCPEMGVQGAAIATLAARGVEVVVLVLYVAVIDKKLHFFRSDFMKHYPKLWKSYGKFALAVVPAGMVWALATPIQSALIGRLSADAIAANSVTTTYYQLLKVIAQALSSASAVIIGKTVGEKDFAKARSGARTVEVLSLAVGIALGGALFAIKNIILSLYTLTPEALRMTDTMLIIMCFVMVAMSYEVPVLFGVIRAGGDAKFTSFVNISAMWLIAMPLAFMATFWWKLDVIWVVAFIQSEQLIKCLPAFIRIRQYDKWMKVVTE